MSFLILVPISALLSLLDGRMIDGSNVWLKPLKFQVSVAIFLATLAVMVPLARPTFRRSVPGRITVWLAIVTSVFEIGWITLRAGMGERSHYATDTAFGGIMYGLMGVAAVILSLTPIAVAISGMRATSGGTAHSVLRWAGLFGAAVGLVGASVIGIMLGGSPQHYPVDAQDAATRLPIAGWSTERGDLRIAHFIGLHAMQGLLVAGLLVLTLSPRVAKLLLALLAIGWLLGTIGLARMAVEGRSPFAGLRLPEPATNVVQSEGAVSTTSLPSGSTRVGTSGAIVVD